MNLINVKTQDKAVNVARREKVLFPESRITKGDLIDYYNRISKFILPLIADRPLSMQRFPNGIDEDGFIQKEAPDYFPDWIKRVRLEKKEGGAITQLVCQNTATLVYLANQACVTYHTWLSKIDKPDHPDRMIFDLDPPQGDFKIAVFGAKMLHALLTKEMEIKTFIMTTGSKGLHIIVPLDRSADFERSRKVAQQIAENLAQRFPHRLTTEARKDKRDERLFIDTARNAYGQTAVAPYSVRARDGAPIATPIFWDEINDFRMHSQKYNIQNIYRRFTQRQDPWKDIEYVGYAVEDIRKKFKSGIAR